MSASEGGGTFSNRWGMLLVMLGMAVGTGNIWRFPRIAATNGGGTFLIPWAIFLLTWSVPLLLVEFAMGKAARRGPIGAFATMIGERWAWMGAWVALCATFIMFYYSVVTGWTLRYLTAAVLGELPGAEPGALWEGYAGSIWAVLTMAISLGISIWVVARGVRGIEQASRVLMPILLVLVVILAIRAVTLPGASRGLAFLFTPDLAGLGNSRVWLEALTQNAWDTGAGWGLALTYAIYMRAPGGHDGERVRPRVREQLGLAPGGHHGALHSVLDPARRVGRDRGRREHRPHVHLGAAALRRDAGRADCFMAAFFLALFFAALTSLISMVELATRVLVDKGMARGRAITWVAVAGFVLGVPSALSLAVFENQDNVWGVGLLLSGLFFGIAVLRYGVNEFRERFVNSAGSDMRIGRIWNVAIWVVTLEALILLVWWLSQTISEQGWAASLDPFARWSLGTILLQFAVVLVLCIAFNRRLARLAGPVERIGGEP